MSMSMSSTFSSWSDYQTQILFSAWDVETWPEYVLSCAVVAFCVVLYHGNRYLLYLVEDKMINGDRVQVQSHTSTHQTSASYQAVCCDEVPSKDEQIPETNPAFERHSAGSSVRAEPVSESMYFSLRIVHALISGLNYGLSLMLMLVAMTFIPGLFLSLVIGYVIGDLIFYVKIRELTYEECH